MARIRNVTARQSLSRHPSWGGLFPALGWALLLLGLILVIVRLRADLAHQWPRKAFSRIVPVAHLRAEPPLRAPGPRPTIVPLGATMPGLPIEGGPRLGARLMNVILAAYGSPLRGHGAELVALSRRYRVDDAVALAFFVMESRAGTRGEALLTNNVGNLRPSQSPDSYRGYGSWLAGAAEWFQIMRQEYLDALKLTTVEAAVPVYAPASDYNDPDTMIAGIRQLVRCWRGMVALCPNDPPGVAALVAGVHGPAYPVGAPTVIASGHISGSP